MNSSDVANYSELALDSTRSTLSIGLSSTIVILICLTSILGNVAVIHAVLDSRHMREKASNIFLINLSITDLGSALFVMLSAFVCIAFDLYSVNMTWCNMLCAVNYCLIIVSMLTLALISLDRLTSVLYPFKYYDIITKGRVVAVIIFTWIQGLAFGVAPAVMGWVHYDYWEAVCAINWHYEPRDGPITYVIVAFAICFALPALVMSISYTVTIKYAKQSMKNMSSSAPSRGHPGEDVVNCRKHSKDEYLAVKTITSMLVVVVMFFVCLTPFSVTKLLKVLTNDPHCVPPYVNLWAAFFAYLSSVVNPFIYGILRPDFRRAYKHMWQRMRRKMTYHAAADSSTVMPMVNRPAANRTKQYKVKYDKTTQDISYQPRETSCLGSG